MSSNWVNARRRASVGAAGQVPANSCSIACNTAGGELTRTVLVMSKSLRLTLTMPGCLPAAAGVLICNMCHRTLSLGHAAMRYQRPAAQFAGEPGEPGEPGERGEPREAGHQGRRLPKCRSSR